jgi:hypothetical protein
MFEKIVTVCLYKVIPRVTFSREKTARWGIIYHFNKLIGNYLPPISQTHSDCPLNSSSPLLPYASLSSPSPFRTIPRTNVHAEDYSYYFPPISQTEPNMIQLCLNTLAVLFATS